MSSGAKKPYRPVKALRRRRKTERFLVEFGLEESFCVGSVWGEDHALLSTEINAAFKMQRCDVVMFVTVA